MARLISVRNKNGILWNLPTKLNDWYVYVINQGELRTGRLSGNEDGRYFAAKKQYDILAKVKAWCRLDGNMNNELVQPEDFVIVDEFLREV